jgi:hypothetical protein
MWAQLRSLSLLVEILCFRVGQLEKRVAALEQAVAQLWSNQGE